MASKLPQISPRTASGAGSPGIGAAGGGAGAAPQFLQIAPIGTAAATSTRGEAISRPRPRRRASAPEGMAEAMASATKAVGLDDFELLFKLGEGGGGTVWQCTKKDSLESFAIKIVEKSSIVSTGSITRLVAERTIMSMFESAFVTKLHFAFQSETQVYFVLELVSGGDLLRVMRQFPGQRMTEDQARFYICELVLAIEYIHASSISFRDLKPENVLVTAEGHLKVADFGLATKSSNDLGQPFRNKTLCGTPEYMAPEMIKETGHGTMVDVWALGCMAYEFLEGVPPFTGAMQEMFVGVLSGKPAFSTSASATAMDLINALLHKEPNHRLGANCMDEIKSHAFFRGVDWPAVERQEARPPMRPRTVGGEDQVEVAALMARIRSDFKPYASPAHSPSRSMVRSPLCNRVARAHFGTPQHDISPQSVSAELEEDAGFPPNKSICVVCSDTHKILQRDAKLSKLTGLPYSRTDAQLHEVMDSKEDADIVQRAIMRVLLMSAGDSEHTESVCVHLTPVDAAASSQMAAVDIRRSQSTSHAAVLRITLASM